MLLKLRGNRQRDGFGPETAEIDSDRSMQAWRQHRSARTEFSEQRVTSCGRPEQADVGNVSLYTKPQMLQVDGEVMAHDDGSIDLFVHEILGRSSGRQVEQML